MEEPLDVEDKRDYEEDIEELKNMCAIVQEEDRFVGFKGSSEKRICSKLCLHQ